MLKRLFCIVILLALASTSVGCSSPAIFEPVVASDTICVPIIENTLKSSGDKNAIENEETEIYVAHISMQEFEHWLRSTDIETAAREEGRSEAEVSTEWERAGIRAVPLPIFEDNPDIWVVFLRGIQHDPGPLFSSNPRDWDPDAELDSDFQSFLYDNFYQIYDNQGHLLNSGALVDSQNRTPLGTRVPLDQIYDDEYMVERELETQPTPSELQSFPTSTPIISPGN